MISLFYLTPWILFEIFKALFFVVVAKLNKYNDFNIIFMDANIFKISKFGFFFRYVENNILEIKNSYFRKLTSKFSLKTIIKYMWRVETKQCMNSRAQG